MGKGAGANDTGAEVPMRKDFFWRDTNEPHAERKKAIMAKYGPEVAKLQTPDWRPAPFVIAIVLSQLALAYYSGGAEVQKDAWLYSSPSNTDYWGNARWNWDWKMYLAVAWIWGGALNHALSLMTHELSHNLLFKEGSSPWKNQSFAIFCNVAMAIPSSTKFKQYHLEHHREQGDHDIDTDIPTNWEGLIFRNSFTKAIWLLFQPAFYALRPTIVSPKKMTKSDFVNLFVILATDACVWYVAGLRGLMYLVLSSLLGMGWHPVAGHFISEHYVFDDSGTGVQNETYSYYGPLNLICWNVGYHNEHHDFPNIPGWRLPELRKLAPEFYDTLPQCHSWPGCLWRFVTDPSVSTYNRVLKRKGKKAE